jgi:hypothetical protein
MRITTKTVLFRLRTLFSPNFPNKTTSVANVIIKQQPHYLIHTENNEVMRRLKGSQRFAKMLTTFGVPLGVKIEK